MTQGYMVVKILGNVKLPSAIELIEPFEYMGLYQHDGVDSRKLIEGVTGGGELDKCIVLKSNRPFNVRVKLLI